ncbi:phage/plasmid replication protein, protein II/X domain protein [Acinetobacter sp. WC-743]|uniref:phage/plasmid replication protein, II/X family n=1 Tax=Acinetobacter sp. WC-743 TaxID=903945 RepID=UPI0002AE9EE6|nr:phage/plasmid replication protein, II/X family [Acinetobacter sp. WC-743]ELW76677.1 phage/plasmid replication protein, protein II/X domain protein [Acinetobacter sp. WC-743]
MNFIRKEIEIDWISFNIEVNHDPAKISDGSIIFSNIYVNNFEDIKKIDESNFIIKSKPKNIFSDFGKLIQLNSIDGKRIIVKSNIFKWLNGHNITGDSNLIFLVVKFVEDLKDKGLIDPTEEQLSNIRKGNFRVYRVDVKQDLIFSDKNSALRYLDHIKKLGIYPYKAKKIFKNGCYFGFESRTRWNLQYYHKGTEISNQNPMIKANRELFALSELMIRSEIRILNDQLKDWNLKYGYQWSDLNQINNFFTEKFTNLRLPNIKERNELLDIKDSADRKFYLLAKNSCINDLYSRATIYKKRIRFLELYGIDIDEIAN